MIRGVMSLLHEKYENMISEYLDGELSEAEEKELILHLEGCPDCAEHLAFVKKLSEKLPIASEEPSADFAEKLMGKLSFELIEEKKEEKKFIKFFNKKSFALAACLALVMITAFFALPRLSYNMKSAAPQMAAEEAANENKDEMKAFDYAADSEAGSGDTMTEFGSAAAPEAEKGVVESRFESSLISALGDISAENPAFELYDSDANMIYESTAGTELIYALLAEAHESEKKEILESNYELIFTSEGSELRLKIYTEDKAFYIYSEDFDKAFRAERNFSEFIRGLFGLSLGS